MEVWTDAVHRHDGIVQVASVVLALPQAELHWLK